MVKLSPLAHQANAHADSVWSVAWSRGTEDLLLTGSVDEAGFGTSSKHTIDATPVVPSIIYQSIHTPESFRVTNLTPPGVEPPTSPTLRRSSRGAPPATAWRWCTRTRVRRKKTKSIPHYLERVLGAGGGASSIACLRSQWLLRVVVVAWLLAAASISREPPAAAAATCVVVVIVQSLLEIFFANRC
jgi:hypothetical protein